MRLSGGRPGAWHGLSGPGGAAGVRTATLRCGGGGCGGGSQRPDAARRGGMHMGRT